MSMLQNLRSMDSSLQAACRAFAIPERARPTPPESEFLARAKRSTLKVGAEHIVYWTLGKGPRVLLVHGWGSRGSHLVGFVEPLLAAGFSVALFDAAGHGDSEGVLSSMIHAGRATLALAAVLGDFHSLISHSGGSTAALWALANGLSVNKSVHICGPSSMRYIVNGISHVYGLGIKDAEAFQRWIEVFTSTGPRSADLTALTAGLSHKGLIVHDAGDRVVKVSQSETLHEAWLSSELLITEGLGHRRILSDFRTITTIVEFLGSEI